MFAEPDERFSPRMISLMQEILNLLNVCSTEHGSQESVLKVILYLFQQLPSCNILALPTITAGMEVIMLIYMQYFDTGCRKAAVYFVCNASIPSDHSALFVATVSS